MTLLPLDKIRLDWKSHASALRWIGLLYRSPKRVEKAEKALSHGQRTMTVLRIYLHGLPYLVVLCTVGRWIEFGVLGLAATWDLTDIGSHAVGLALILAGGLTLALAFGLAFGLTFGLAFGLAFGLTGGLASGLAGGLAFGLTVGFANGLTFGLAFGLAFGLGVSLLAVGRGENVAAGWSGVIGWTVGYCLVFLRIYYLPFHFLWLWPRLRPRQYRFHPVAWDEVCLLPFPALDRLLVALPDEDREREINRLIDDYPSQRNVALRARATLVARRAAGTREPASTRRSSSAP